MNNWGYFTESHSHYQKEAIGEFSRILVLKLGVWPIFHSQKPYMCKIRQTAHGNLFILILVIDLYAK